MREEDFKTDSTIIAAQRAIIQGLRERLEELEFENQFLKNQLEEVDKH